MHISFLNTFLSIAFFIAVHISEFIHFLRSSCNADQRAQFSASWIVELLQLFSGKQCIRSRKNNETFSFIQQHAE